MKKPAAKTTSPKTSPAPKKRTYTKKTDGLPPPPPPPASPPPKRAYNKKPKNTAAGKGPSHGHGDWTNQSGMRGTGLYAVLSTLGALALILSTCPAAVYLWFLHEKMGGDCAAFYDFYQKNGIKGLYNEWPTPSAEAWGYVAGFAVLTATIQLLMPGKPFDGPVTPKGNVPKYKANGVQSFLFTHALFFATWYIGYFNPARVHELLGEIIAATNLFALGFCAMLTLKGHFAPSSSDSGGCGNLIFDFYWGTELYPRIGPLDLKMFTNCRWGMMLWSLLPLCYTARQMELYGSPSAAMLVSVILTEVYVFKFFVWEAGYMKSIDIMHDRAGYYICWGCLVWVPSLYTSPSLYFVRNPGAISLATAAFMLFAGLLMIWVNYDADRQRADFRTANGLCNVWGKPAKFIKAKYVTASGQTKESLLLLSGYWGMSRHFHYLPEILASFFWSVPGLFKHISPYFYVIFLTILLVDRAHRDDGRCAGKYGKFWDQYKKQVSYWIVPGVY